MTKPTPGQPCAVCGAYASPMYTAVEPKTGELARVCTFCETAWALSRDLSDCGTIDVAASRQCVRPNDRIPSPLVALRDTSRLPEGRPGGVSRTVANASAPGPTGDPDSATADSRPGRAGPPCLFETPTGAVGDAASHYGPKGPRKVGN
jgi:hypothetical protein